jgi:holo-[acyl-carrier protein] synthase
VAATGIGLDLLEIDRLERALDRRPRLAERLFTDGERSYASAHTRPGRHLAARFCAKEAVAKALGLAGFSFREVEVVAGDAAPRVRLSGAAAARAGELGVTPVVSLTHERSMAGAAAVLSPQPSSTAFDGPGEAPLEPSEG